MADSSAKDGYGKIRTSANGPRKFTLSCSRCRASKLKCDKQQPCMECVKRGIGDLCIKDERRSRVKKVKTGQHKNDNTNPKPNQENEVEEAVQALEHFVGVNYVSRSTVLEPTLSFPVPDYPNTYWYHTDDPRRQNEKIALIREIVDAMPELEIIYLLYETFVTRCQGPLGNVVHTPTFMKQAENFCGCLALASLEAQVMALSSTVPMDALASLLMAIVLALAFQPTPFLLDWSPTPLTLRVEELRASDVHSKKWRSLALRCLQGGVSLFFGSIAALQAAIMLLLDGQERSSNILSLDAILVNAISGAQKLGLHRLGDATLEVSVSATSFPEDGSSASTERSYIRTEIGIRIWWAFVVRDWSRGLALGYYSIHPSHFNTRIPLHINDADLCPTTSKVNILGHIIERPLSEFTMLSYTVHALKVATFARESIDFRGTLRQAQQDEGTTIRAYLNKRYESLIAGLPAYFRLGNTIGLTSAGPEAAIPVHRWMLHQQLWSLFLRLHRSNFSLEAGRASYNLMAQNIISSQAQIKKRCAVCGSLSTCETQLFNAATVLLIDLLFLSKLKETDRLNAQLSRVMTRDKIWEAIELLRTPRDAAGSPSTSAPRWERIEVSGQRSVIALEALMKLEEEESVNDEKVNGEKLAGKRPEALGTSSDCGARKTLKKKVIEILKTLQETPTDVAAAMEQAISNSFSALDASVPLPTATDGMRDLDVLPILSNEPSCDFWQFLDFASPQSPTQMDFFSTTA